MDGFEKRRHRRLAIKLYLSCRKVGVPAQKLHAGCTVNVGAGGLFFETTDAEFERGDLAEVRLSVPPTAGLLELGGTMCALGRVLRAGNISNPHTGSQSSLVRGVALEFSRPPKLCM